MKLATIILLCSVLASTLTNSVSVDIIRSNQAFRDGDTIISAGGEFELGFFSPGSSTNRYLGIWYSRISKGTVVWVANRDHPLMKNSGVVQVTDRGITLQTVNSSDGIVWSSNTSTSLKNLVVQILDTGNLVLRDEDQDINDVEDFIWQSFDHPTDNMLPGMKLGIDLVRGIDRYYTSWKSDDDPSVGSFTNRLDPHGFPQFFLMRGSEFWSRTGPWNGYKLSGTPNFNPNGIYTDKVVFNKKEIYYTFDLINKTSAIMRFFLTPSGDSECLVWNDHQQNWMVYLTLQDTDCDRYGLCGNYGRCNVYNTPRCSCLRGFIPKFPEKWKAADWSGGCIRKTKLVCGTGEGFVKYSGVKLPDMRHSWYDMTINLKECKRLCLKNCNCTAYANVDVRSGGHGCHLWYNDLIDIRDLTEDGQDIYVRMPSSEIEKSWSSRGKKKLVVIAVLTVVLLGGILHLVHRMRKLQKEESLKLSSESVHLTKVENEDLDLPLFDFKTIANATSNFSPDKILGEGGFGPVYKGMLDGGQEIAAKRLSSNSSQGLDEFKNEVSCIAKLQHRNLVTLLGCCTEKGERILIYEYMANRSLDSIIFDENSRNTMDWPKRCNIINGIARGLMYLHQDSKLRVIHRDLKASNILLDHEMNPKISDFGMARSFGGNETEANTSRVVGTYGYMSPEYAIDGQFSVKSDVYSFGVLLLEIISGVKNRLFTHPDHSLNLLGHAWMSYKEDKLLQLIDEVILESSNHTEVFRVIQIGLLCVQHDPKDRPVMSEVVLMLSSNMKLPHPKQPGFFMERYFLEADHFGSNAKLSSSNDLTITALLPRPYRGLYLTMELTTIILLCYTATYILINSLAADKITRYQTFRDGDTIISAGGEFELGFFSPGSSTNRYLGIWYKKISEGTVVWVANRDRPLTDSSGSVLVDGNGITILQSVNGTNGIIWTANTSNYIKNPVVQLLDSGNLVLMSEDLEGFVWQSFDYPANTLLPGMKIGIDLVTGIERYYTSWKTDNDPSIGRFSQRLDPSGFPQFFWMKGSVIWSRTGPWNGYKFNGNPNSSPNGIYKDTFVFNEKEVYYKFDLTNRTSAVMRYIMTTAGVTQLLVWNDQLQQWSIYLSLQNTDCGRYGSCGAYGICDIKNSPRCGCLRGFVPKFPEKWKAADWSDGCVRKTRLVCGTKEGFVKYSGVKLPDTRHIRYDLKINLKECENLCLKNCSCTAYANAYVTRGGQGCLLWFSDLIDIGDYKEDGQDIYVKMSASEMGESWRSGSKRQIQFIVIPAALVVTLLGVIFLLIFTKRKLIKEEKLKSISETESVALTKMESEDFDLPLFDFKRIANATSNFCRDKKLGEGGFGPVYKGILDDGRELAVKRLSKNSSQGLDEFKNEVSCIAKLQHRNLVTLLGCCIEKGERILIYEYMANKSLDLIIFDEKVKNTMDWPKRYSIISGIARGLLYLHQDSKLRIIHRDLKASNILLDHEMNPKISDFGMARIFGGNETEANTSRVVGTYGYMSPEYAIDGQFSVKSDIYSFGVLLIEIVCGVKNRLFTHPDHSLNLLGHAWLSYKGDKLLQLIDGVILDSSNHIEVFRVIQIGLLCVQNDPKDRPVMSQVVLMLSSNMKLPHPKQPGFFMERYLLEADYSLSSPNLSSSNQFTITTLLPRQ
nr:PREDICTED: uncharacterized protein LOC108221773 [Daucus carota subsp. sativus]